MAIVLSTGGRAINPAPQLHNTDLSPLALWQLQGAIEEKLGSPHLQVPDARRGAIHSHAGTGTYITVSILEKA